MSVEERDKEKEIQRQKDYEDIESGRCTPREINDRNAIDRIGVKVTIIPDDFEWRDDDKYEWEDK